jgi:hypothetical protein
MVTSLANASTLPHTQRQQQTPLTSSFFLRPLLLIASCILCSRAALQHISDDVSSNRETAIHITSPRTLDQITADDRQCLKRWAWLCLLYASCKKRQCSGTNLEGRSRSSFFFFFCHGRIWNNIGGAMSGPMIYTREARNIQYKLLRNYCTVLFQVVLAGISRLLCVHYMTGRLPYTHVYIF